MELFSYSISDPNLKYQVSRQNGSLIMNNLEDTDAGVYEFNLESSHYGNKKGKITVNVDGMYYFYFYEKTFKVKILLFSKRLCLAPFMDMYKLYFARLLSCLLNLVVFCNVEI